MLLEFLKLPAVRKYCNRTCSGRADSENCKGVQEAAGHLGVPGGWGGFWGQREAQGGFGEQPAFGVLFPTQRGARV